MDIADVLTIPLTNNQELIIASDNSGAIGEKEDDAVHVPNEVTGYYTCRVAYMDLLRTKGTPKAIILQNFTGEDAWNDYVTGIQKLLNQTRNPSLPITGSTESNFATLQSGLGFTLIGVRNKGEQRRKKVTKLDSFAVIGKPLVGYDVIKQKDQIAPISLYEELASMKEVIDLIPVGSKGIEAEWQKLTGVNLSVKTTLDVEQSGGPATCFIIAYKKENETKLKQLTKSYFHPLKVLINPS